MRRPALLALASPTLIGVVLIAAGCASTRPAPPAEPPPEVLRLAAALDTLGFAVLPAGLGDGAEPWDDLAWTVREAVESAVIRRHFLVRGDEVDVLVYESERVARHEGERVREGVGPLPLAAQPDPAGGASGLVPATYFVAGPVVVRQRGADPAVFAALAGALGAPVEDARRPGGLGIDYAPPAPDLTYDPYAIGPRRAPLYQGEDVPSWSVDPAMVNGPYGAAYRALYYSN